MIFYALIYVIYYTSEVHYFKVVHLRGRFTGMSIFLKLPYLIDRSINSLHEQNYFRLETTPIIVVKFLLFLS